MHRALRLSLIVAAASLAMTGCATTAKTDEQKNKDQRLAQEAPLGSRIRKKSNVAPVLGATRDDIERARVQQGAVATGAYQNPGN